MALADSGVVVRVAVPRVDADAWKEVWAATGSGARGASTMPALAVVSIRTPVLRLFGRDYTEVDTVLQPRDDGWRIALNMQQAAGELIWRGAGEGSLAGRLQRMVIRPAAEAGGGPNAALLKTLPALNLAVDDFRIGDKALGQLDLRARNEQGAWHLETLHLRNPDGALNGTAVWRNDGAGRHQTRLDFGHTKVRHQTEITVIDDRLTAYRDKLLQQYAALEAAFTSANQLLQMLDANANARNNA